MYTHNYMCGGGSSRRKSLKFCVGTAILWFSGLSRLDFERMDFAALNYDGIRFNFLELLNCFKTIATSTGQFEEE